MAELGSSSVLVPHFLWKKHTCIFLRCRRRRGVGHILERATSCTSSETRRSLRTALKFPLGRMQMRSRLDLETKKTSQNADKKTRFWHYSLLMVGTGWAGNGKLGETERNATDGRFSLIAACKLRTALHFFTAAQLNRRPPQSLPKRRN